MNGIPVDWGFAVRLHGARVIASVLKLGIPLDQAEELASQAWAHLIEKHRAGELTEITLPGLAIQQAHFYALNWLKRGGRTTTLDDAPEQVSPLTPETQLIARRDVDRVLGVLAKSSAKAQAIFFHLYDEPTPRHEVIAALVGLSTQRVRQIICEVRREMRAALEESQ